MHRSARVLLNGLIILAVLLSSQASTARSAAFDCSAVTEVPQAECQALVTLYNSTGGDHWNDRSFWLQQGTSLEDWAGVTLGGGHVVVLSMERNNLTGSLPPELGNLSNLKELYFIDNQLSGPLPPELGKLSGLQRLILWGSPFTGSIPSSYGNLTELIAFVVAHTQLTGPIPDLSRCTKMDDLALFDNQLTGPLPTWIGSLASLTGLELESNQLSGPIPHEIGSLHNLQRLHLMANYFTGAIPPELWTLTNLTWLGFRGSNLTGPISHDIGNLTQLKVIDFRFSLLSGELPSELGSLTQLDTLLLDSNDFTGPIPSSLGSLTNLTVLGLADNKLTGPVPSELANLTNLVGKGQAGWGIDGLNLGFNHLTVPSPWPSNPPTALDNLLLAKDPEWYVTQAVDAPVTPDQGGTLTSNGGAAEINVPPGAVSGDTTLQFEPKAYPDQGTGNLQLVATTFNMSAVDGSGQPVTAFKQPLTITLHYTDADVAGLYEDKLLLYYWDEGSKSWKDASTTCPQPNEYTRDLSNNVLSVGVCHFTEFALLGNQKHYLYLPLIVKMH